MLISKHFHFFPWLLGASLQTQLPFREKGGNSASEEMPKTQEAELDAGLLEPGSSQGAFMTESKQLRSQWNNLGSPGPPIHPVSLGGLPFL